MNSFDQANECLRPFDTDKQSFENRIDCIIYPLDSHNNHRGRRWTSSPFRISCALSLIHKQTGELFNGAHHCMHYMPATAKCSLVNQFNIHLKVQTHFPHELLSMCWNIGIKFIYIFPQNSNQNSHVSEPNKMIFHVCVCLRHSIQIPIHDLTIITCRWCFYTLDDFFFGPNREYWCPTT